MGQHAGRSTSWLLSTDVGCSRVSRIICCYHGGLHRRGDQTGGLGHRTPGQIARRIRCEYGFGVYMRHVGRCWLRQPYHPEFIVYRKSAALDIPGSRTEVRVLGYAIWDAWHNVLLLLVFFDPPPGGAILPSPASSAGWVYQNIGFSNSYCMAPPIEASGYPRALHEPHQQCAPP